MHVVWDWNGTIKDDLDDHVAALNATLPALGGTPVDRDTYQAERILPLADFYARLLGREISERERETSDAAFLTHLRAQPVRLHGRAVELLSLVQEAGHTQSLLSLCPHDTLVREVEEAGIGHFFTRIDGRTGPPGGSKAVPLARHLRALGLTGRERRVLVIGDSLDDADSAYANGAIGVLHSEGLHDRDRLAEDGYPVASSLAGALVVGCWLVRFRTLI
ncbi:HAD family hydrolase [Kitasatospora sp. NRRL B-11411]|uniref:HAD family hydrolase n=1 Tax=Kitasatospora sp. NRRL B-11411 TaxID=1463822 RepID=UPI00068B84AF|nr:HAD hydrolase-like protein [Kitasatospora sp. NRRL B-11411]